MKFKKSILFSFAAVLVLCLSAASASDPAINETVGAAESDEELGVDAQYSRGAGERIKWTKGL